MALDFSSAGAVPAQPATPPPAQAGGLDFSSVGGVPATPQQPAQTPPKQQQPAAPQGEQPGLMHQLLDEIVHRPETQTTIGAVKQARQGLAGLLTILGTPNGAAGLATGQDPRTMIDPHVQRAADWLNKNTEEDGFWQHVGGFGENVAEFLTPDALASLGRAGSAAEGVKAATNAEKMVEAGKVAATIEKLPPRLKALIGIGMSAARSGAEAGTQTFVHTGGDADEAAKAAALGAGTHGLIEGAAQGVGAVARRIAQPSLTTDAIEDTAKGALEREANTTNATRVPAPPNPNAEPYTFSIKGTPTEDTTSGQIAQQPRKQQVGTRVISGKGPSERQVWIDPATNVPQAVDIHSGDTNAAGSHRAPSYRLSEESRPGTVTREDSARGGGELLTQDPNVAAAHLQSLDQIVRSPEYAEMPPEQQQVYRAQRADIQRQIAEHYQATKAAGGNQPNFAPIDVKTALKNSHTFEDAADQLYQSAQPVYEHANRVSGGQWQVLKDTINKLSDQLGDEPNIPSNQGVRAKLARQIRESESAMSRILDDPKNGIDRDDADRAIRMMHAQFVLRDAHKAIEPIYDIEQHLPLKSGEYKGYNGNRLGARWQAFLRDRPEARQILGSDQVDTLGQMFKKTETWAGRKRIGQGIMAVASALAGGAAGAVTGGASGHAAAGALGGVGAGELSYMGLRHVVEGMVLNPRFAKNLLFAVDSGARPQNYAPGLAKMLDSARASAHVTIPAAASAAVRSANSNPQPQGDDHP